MGKNCKSRWGAVEKRVPDGHKKSHNGIVGREKVPKAPIGGAKSNVIHVGPRAKRGKNCENAKMGKLDGVQC